MSALAKVIPVHLVDDVDFKITFQMQ